ncbi:MAG TPA: efflux RND transporter periplasmic adaptor subunit [Rhizomicrobium sp.]
MPDPNAQAGLRRGGVVLLGIAAVIVVAVVVLHYAHISTARADLERDTAKGPQVQVITAGASGGVRDITILADVRPYQEATLYAKVSGYLAKVLVDKGDKVKAGQLLATLESQETDAQYASAAADLANKKQIAQRYDQLARQNAIAVQQKDQADADARVAQAVLNQNATLKNYERITAPFDGKITARFADPGALLQNAANSQTSSQPVVTVSDDRKLRIDAFVQQQDAPFVHAGDGADIVDAANKSRKISAHVTRVSGALDPRTRTMLVEVMLDNPDGALLSGSFAYMTLHVPEPSATQIPVGAMISRGADQFIALVDQNSRLHLVKIEVASTDGDTITLVQGLKPGTKIAVDLPPEAVDGAPVQAVMASTK